MRTRHSAADRRGSVRAMRAVMSVVGEAQKERRAQCARGLRAAGSGARRLIERAGLVGRPAGLSAARARCRRAGPLGTTQEAERGRRRQAVGPHVERAAAARGPRATIN